jgi:anti-anti-sigma regulatory factor
MTPSDHSPLPLAGPLTIATVRTWQEQFARSLEAPSGLSLDLGPVTDIDAFGLQLLWSARRAAEARGKAFRLTGAPPAFAHACERAGVPADRFSPLNPHLP